MLIFHQIELRIRELEQISEIPINMFVCVCVCVFVICDLFEVFYMVLCNINLYIYIKNQGTFPFMIDAYTIAFH